MKPDQMIYEIAIGITALVSLILNAVLICVISKHKSKTTYFALCLQLSICNVLLCIVGYGSEIVLKIYPVLSKELCIASGFAITAFSFVAISLLTSITISQIVSILAPYKSQKWIKTKQFLYTFSILSWVASVVIAALPLFAFRNNGYSMENNENRCGMDWRNKSEVYKAYQSSILFLYFILPAFSLTLLFQLVRKYHTKRKMTMKRKEILSTKNSNRNNHRDNEIKVHTMIALLIFLIVWTPYGICAVITSFFPTISLPPWLLDCAAIFAKISAIVNPVTYYVRFKMEKPKMETTTV